QRLRQMMQQHHQAMDQTKANPNDQQRNQIAGQQRKLQQQAEAMKRQLQQLSRQAPSAGKASQSMSQAQQSLGQSSQSMSQNQHEIGGSGHVMEAELPGDVFQKFMRQARDLMGTSEKALVAANPADRPTQRSQKRAAEILESMAKALDPDPDDNDKANGGGGG